MTNLNTFESVFKAADKPVHVHTEIEINRLLFVTDLADADATRLINQALDFLTALGDGLEWHHLGGDDFDSVGTLIECVEAAAPDLIITYRHLNSGAWHWPHGLGEYLDVLTQATDIPVLVLPHPDANRALPHAIANTDRVMAMTDHIAADARLIDAALRFTAKGGTCWLTHIESRNQFDHFVAAVEKIPEIDTEDVRELVEAQLLKEPRDYVASCRRVVKEAGATTRIEALVMMGDRLEEYRRLINEHEIDLLVMNTMDGDQLAMHGQAYPLAVELRGIPLLML
jgi:hypothetical protein